MKRRAPRWPLATALAAALWLLPGWSAPLPNLGDDTGLTLSVERQQGDRVVRELYRDPDFLDDPILAEYVQGLWQPLLAAARARGELSPEQDERFAWEILLGRDPSINAFALPGGYLGLNLGLIATVTRPEELASVLAHELSHVTQRHLARMSSQQGRQAPWVLATLVLAAIAASKNPDAANALMVGGQAAAVQSQLRFSRDMEREADRVGFGVLSEAGFAPQGFVSMFEKLQHAARLNDDGSYPYLRSHPLTTERIADMQARVGPVAAGATPQTLAQAMVSARARILTRPGVDALRSALSQASDPQLTQRPPAVRAATYYAAVLAALALHEPAGAALPWQRLQQLLGEPGTPAAALQQGRWLQADIALATGDAARQRAAIQALVTGGDNDRATRLLLGELRLQTGQARAVSDSLQPWVTEHPDDATAWQLLGRSWAAQNEVLRAVRAEGEVQLARRDYSGAVDRFKAGLSLGASTGSGEAQQMELSILSARLREAQRLQRDIQDEAR